MICFARDDWFLVVVAFSSVSFEKKNYKSMISKFMVRLFVGLLFCTYCLVVSYWK